MDPSLLYLQMLPIEQKGWLTLHLKESETVTAQAMIGHIGTSSVVILSFLQDPIPSPEIKQVEFRFINQSGIYTLSSSSLEMQGYDNGRVRLFMYPPYSMTHRQQREFIRIEPETALSVSFTPIFPDEYHSGEGTIHNLSGNGLLFATDEFIHHESILKVTFSLPESPSVITAVAQVVRKEFTETETITSVQFLDLIPDDQKQIISYCVSEQLRIAQSYQQQKRKYARVSSSETICVSIRDVESQHMMNGFALNIGGGGLMISIPEQAATSSLYQIRMNLPQAENAIEAYVKIVDQQSNAEQNIIHLEFIDIKQDDQEQIIDYVLGQQLLLLQTPDEQMNPA